MTLTSTKVLIVEDDAVMATFVVSSLRRLAIETVTVCTDGNSALKSVSSLMPDVILTDVHMKPMDGIEFVQKLRGHANASLRRIPVIFMSADSSRETLDGTMALDSVAYIVKPPRLETLRAKIQQAVQGR